MQDPGNLKLNSLAMNMHNFRGSECSHHGRRLIAEELIEGSYHIMVHLE